MSPESRLLIDIWEVVEDHISKGQRVDAIISILRAFDDYGVEAKDFADAADENAYIRGGYEAVAEDEEPYDDDDQDGEGRY
jgi:hypothetical protein